MPWEKLYSQPGNIGVEPAVPINADLASPTHSEIWGAVWRQEHPAGSFLSNKMHSADLDTVDPTFRAWEEAKGKKYENYPEQLGRLRNPQAYEVWKSQIDMEDEDRRILDAAGWEGTVAKAVISLLDPTLVLAGIGEIGQIGKAAYRAGKVSQAGKAAYRAGKAAPEGLVDGAKIVTKSAAEGVAQEDILHATQETRSVSESVEAVATGALTDLATDKFLEIPEVKRAMQAFSELVLKYAKPADVAGPK